MNEYTHRITSSHLFKTACVLHSCKGVCPCVPTWSIPSPPLSLGSHQPPTCFVSLEISLHFLDLHTTGIIQCLLLASLLMFLRLVRVVCNNSLSFFISE